MNKQTIVFRADGNNEIASGHIMRCLSYARYFKQNGHICIFVTASTDMHEIIKLNGFSVISLNTNFKKMDDEIAELTKIVSQLKPKLIFVDSYFVTKSYLQALKALSKILYLDDLNAFDYPVDYLLNYNIYAKNLNYNKANKICFLGTDYLILREEFENAKPININKIIQNIFITTGASDDNSFVKNFITSCEKHEALKNINYHIIAGRYYKNEDKNFLTLMQQKCGNVFVYKNVSNMSEIMLKCDVAISAGGSTLYELSKLGVPTIAMITADNQINNVNTFVYKSIMLFGGDKSESHINNCLQAIQSLTFDKRLEIQCEMLNLHKERKIDIMIKIIIS